MTDEQMLEWFRYHKPSEPELEHIEAIRAACRTCAETIMRHTPGCADRTVAIRHLGEASMNAVRAVVTADAVLRATQ
jgi:hypothetical protein